MDDGIIKSFVSAGSTMVKVPMSGAQKEIWISSKMAAEASCAYNQAIQIGISGNCKVDVLQKAAKQVIDNHDVFRAVCSDDGQWMLFDAVVFSSVPVVDISGFTSEAKEKFITKQLLKEASGIFDLEQGPLWRATIIVLSPSEIRLFFTAHHLICDGWSLSIIMDSIIQTYALMLSNEESGLSQAPSFAEYLLELQRFATTVRAKEHLEYWKSKFNASVPVLELPTDRPRPVMRTYNAGAISRDIPFQLFADVKKLSVSLQCNPFTIFLSAYAVMLQKITRNSQVIIGISVSGQSFQGKKDLVGHCVTMLPILCNVNPAETFSAFTDTLQDRLYNDYDHYTVSFGELLSTLNIRRTPGRIPLIATCLTYVKMKSKKELCFNEFNASSSISERVFETFEMEGAIVEMGIEHRLLWHFNKDLFQSETIESWINCFLAILAQVTTSPDCPINDIEIQEVPVVQVQPDSEVNNDFSHIKKSVSQNGLRTESGLDFELMEIWHEVLGVSTIGKSDNFFELGGNSILLVTVQKLIKEKLNYTIDIINLFQFPTVEKLSGFIGSNRKENDKQSEIDQRMMLKHQALSNRRSNLAKKK